MNTRALNALAGVIAAAMKQDRTPMGIAIAIESAGMLQSPETAAAYEQLREDITGACLARHEEEQENARLRLALKSAQRGRQSLPDCRCRTDNDGDRNGWIKYRARDGEFVELPCHDHATSVEDPHDSPLHHTYMTARLREDEGADDGR